MFGVHSNLGRRSLITLCLFVLALLAAIAIKLSPTELLNSFSANKASTEFFFAAFTPALDYQAAVVPESAPSFILRIIEAVLLTIWYAAGGVGIALLIGLSFGFFCSTYWWQKGQSGRAGESEAKRRFFFFLYLLSRTLMTLFRSVHELLWAVLFLAAFGVSEISAMIAIGLPSGGMLAKIFAELIDEADAGPARALRDSGLSAFRVFLFAKCPVAYSDLLAYLLYRFECALRSSAVLGFFGLPTLGFYLAASFENLYYREVWSYLYALFFLIILVDAWSGAIRRRISQ